MLAVLFPGQGSQRPGMGSPWRDHPSWSVVEEVSDATGRDVADLLTNAEAETLTATRNAQLAAFTLSLVIADATGVLGRDAVPFGAAAGHSLGEYTALVVAGALTIADGARLVAERGEAMQAASEAKPGTMAAVLGLDVGHVAAACEEVRSAGGEGGGAWMANDNAPGQVVIAGSRDGVSAASDRATELGARRVMGLAVGGAFHSPLMAPAQERLDAALSTARFEPAGAAVVANVDAAGHRDGFADLLSAQLCSPVRWRQSLLTLADLGADRFCELGPGTELSGMVKRTIVDAARTNVATPTDLESAANIVSD